MNTFVRRLLGAAVLDASVYEEVEADQGATTQALAVVLLSSLAAGLGWQDVGANSPASVAVFSTIALIAWVGWAFVTYEIGVRILPEPQTQSNLGELLRTIGFATAPGLLRVFGLLPGARDLVFGVTAVWMLFAMIVAVRQALDYKHTGRAIGVCALGWALSIVFAFVLGLLFGPSVASPSLARTDEQRTGGTPSGFITPSLYGRDNFDFFCAPCHGLEGRGDGPIAAALKTPPSDLTKLATKNNGVYPRQRVEEFVTSGRPVPAHGTTAMPVWGPTFRSLEPSDRLVKERIANVVQYIETLQVK
ncbi:MAG: cytochrome c [Vicinamibacterales bacterium]